MLDIGLGEVIVIAILALLVFGPDRLPKVAADAARALRNVREMATAARRELSDAAGLKDDEELARTVRDLRDLDPRRALKGEGAGADGAAGRAAKASGSAGATAPGGITAAGATTAGAGASQAAGAPAPGPSGGVDGQDLSVQGEQPSPTDPAAPQAAPAVDPDWT